MAAPLWHNWARTQTAHPGRIASPRAIDELVATVVAAGRDGIRVKAVGAGHSFTGAAVTDGILLRLDNLTGLTQVDVDTGRVTVLAGTPLHQLNTLLDAHGLAMSNLGDIDRQTVAGAISTGTHGTGADHRGLAAQVDELELILADGSSLTCSAAQNPEVFAAARIGLGALGIITTTTLRCVPSFLLRADERPMSLAQVLADLDALVDGNDHFEFYWFPHTARVLTKANTRVPDGVPPRPLSRLRAWLDDEFLSNDVFELTNRAVTAMPKLTPTANALAARALSARTYTDRSHRVFTSRRRVVFREMEYAVPRAALRSVITEIADWIDTSGELVSFPVEVRFAAEDDLWLSSAHGRPTAYVAVHQYHRQPYDRYFRAVERITTEHDGRPHWGKIHWLDAQRLRPRYPHFDDFCRVRDELDPHGTFANDYLDRVLGPTPPP